MIKPLTGITNLLASKKATFCLLILLATTTLVFLNKLDGTAYAATMTVISTIYCWTSHRVDLAAISQNLKETNNG